MNDIIYLRKGNDLIEMTEEPYEYERLLQEKLAEYPRLLAGGQLSDSGVDRWALIAREQAVPDKRGGGERWSADHLFVDQDAVPTIVEVKRSDNTEIRRKIVGQMLDYVAHASMFWDAETLRERFVETCDERDISAEETLVALLGEEDTDGFFDDVEKNLRSKQIRLVFVADEVPSELKRVVEFLNETMRDVEVLAIEVVQFASDEETVFVPRLYGQTEEAKASSSTSRTGADFIATEAEMFEDLDRKVRTAEITEAEYRAFVDLYEFSNEIGDHVDISGVKNARVKVEVRAHQGDHSGRPSVFTANVTGKVKVWPARTPLDDENPEESPVSWDPAAFDTFLERFQSLDGVPSGEPRAPFSVLTRGDNLEAFKEMVEEFVEHCRDSAAQ
ncbi:hypothetical protein [Natronobiforma cellulositropha]|uniref:hypothetical protein n=1 Tax=Natronobiforma cellulositropha TaxID=1679076 RepID=UPI0021D59F4C|nr:hypothetical protein [Natronobiforma cellulositropha]